MLETNAVETTDTEVEIQTAPERLKSYYDMKRIRKGKTYRDHNVNGSWRRRFDNNALRAGWRNDSAGKTSGFSPFPTHTCGGLGNSSKRHKVKAGKIIKG